MYCVGDAVLESVSKVRFYCQEVMYLVVNIMFDTHFSIKYAYACFSVQHLQAARKMKLKTK